MWGSPWVANRTHDRRRRPTRRLRFLYRRLAGGRTVPGPLSDRGAVRTGRRVTPSPLGVNNTTFISKIFSQKIWPKNWGGSSDGGFRERQVCGSGPAPPAPFRGDEKHPGGSFFPPAFRQRSHRRAPELLGAESRISVCRRLAHISHIHPRAGQPSCHISATLEDAIARGEPCRAWSCAGGSFPARRLGRDPDFAYGMCVDLWVRMHEAEIVQ
jgi:hypothetical protein